MRVIDAHIHVGNNPKTKQYTLDDLRRDLTDADADGAVCFPFPEDMYRSVDDPRIRKQQNKYVLEVADNADDLMVYPFCYVAMDYVLPEDFDRFVGVKWHRHSDEPRYDYDDPHCKEALKAIEQRKMPMIIEEELWCTEHVAENYPGIPLIIPHLGMLNGGPDRMDVFFDRPDIFFDTGPAGREQQLLRFLENIGPERLIMGSDYSGCPLPFAHTTKRERSKIEGLGLSKNELRLILGENIIGLLS